MKNIKLNITIITVIILSIFLTTITYSTTVSSNTNPNSNNINNELSEQDDRSNNYLQSLSIEGYEIYPEFNKNTTTYYVVIPKTITSLNVLATPEIEDAKVKITGNTSLTKLENTIKVSVTAKNNRIKTYNIIVNKQDDNGLNLVELSIENANLTPEFYSGNYHYSTEIKTDTDYTDLIVNAKANKEDTEIEIIGNKNLEEGEHLITVMLKSGSDTTTYEISVNITKNNIITTVTEENKSFLQLATDKVKEFFSDSFRTIIFLSIIAFIILILVIIAIVKVVKNKKAHSNREKIKGRVK